MSRTQERRDFEERVRISLAETDLDTLEEAVSSINGQLRRLTMAVVGAALSFATASVLLALSLLTGTA